MTKQYATARAFREALEARLRLMSRAQGIDIMRLRRTVAFDRALARLFAAPNPPWLVKGGYAFELRLPGRARATRDIDLTIPTSWNSGQNDLGHLHAVHERLRDELARDLGDWFVFRVGDAMADIEGAPYGGARYPVESRMDNRVFVTFHLDVGVGDAVVSPPEWATEHDLLGFAGITPASIALLPKEQQFAEKIHAYTLPRGERENTRVRDLVDLMELIRMGLAPEITLLALRATFERRRTHPIPEALPPPPQDWQAAYATLAAECDLPEGSIGDAFAHLSTFWAALHTERDE